LLSRSGGLNSGPWACSTHTYGVPRHPEQVSPLSQCEGNKWRWGLHLDEGDILEADTRKGERNNSLL
jgi:hypothetical protein